MNHFLILSLRAILETIQHTQVSTEPFKGITEKYFGEYICQHVLDRNIIELDYFLPNMIIYKMMYINVFGMRVGN